MSRDKNRFLPVTPQDSIFTLRHVGDSEPAFKNSSYEVTFRPLGPFHTIKILMGRAIYWEQSV